MLCARTFASVYFDFVMTSPPMTSCDLVSVHRLTSGCRNDDDGPICIASAIDMHGLTCRVRSHSKGTSHVVCFYSLRSNSWH